VIAPSSSGPAALPIRLSVASSVRLPGATVMGFMRASINTDDKSSLVRMAAT